jgi:hypothetical protein
MFRQVLLSPLGNPNESKQENVKEREALSLSSCGQGVTTATTTKTRHQYSNILELC